jgi:hypothetical protein
MNLNVAGKCMEELLKGSQKEPKSCTNIQHYYSSQVLGCVRVIFSNIFPCVIYREVLFLLIYSPSSHRVKINPAVKRVYYYSFKNFQAKE